MAGRSGSTLRFGILGAAWIAERALIPALARAGNAELVAIASRDPDRASRLFDGPVLTDYEAVLASPIVDAVYIPLPNSLHRTWAIRALAAGKHVLCEKPLALDAAEAGEMAAAARAAGRLLMEAAMYRFHPRMRALVAGLRERPPPEIAAGFGFRLQSPGNYRLDPALGGGALLDVGFYPVSLARWIYGEPETVRATGHLEAVDLTVEMTLTFAGGRRADLFASFETEEIQYLRAGDVRVEQPFTAYLDPHDPYQLMVEEFSAAALDGLPAPLLLEDSIANLRVLDRVRRCLDAGDGDDLPEGADRVLPAGE